MKTSRKKVQLQLRKERIRKKIQGSGDRPRLCVYKSSKHIYAQIINDLIGKTLVAASTIGPDFKDQKEFGELIREQSGLFKNLVDKIGLKK